MNVSQIPISSMTMWLLFLAIGCQPVQRDTITLGKEELRDKIKGAWAVQTIGVTFGSPIEFKYNGTMVQDYQRIS